jgi:FAD-dependent oxidoreductase domain-containing protein 1
MGSSIAYHLASNPGFDGRILVIEPDPTYQRSASALSASSIRQQFSSPVNIRVSLFGIDFLRKLDQHLAVDGEKPAIGFKEGGYLYIAATAEGRQTLADINAIQIAEGANIAFLEPKNIRTRFPYMETADLSAGTLGITGEGWFDGYGLMQAFRTKARSLGVEYRQSKVVDIERSGNRITAAMLANGNRIACGHFVNAAGASGSRVLAGAMGYPIPVYAKKRCVFPFTCKSATPDLPLLIDTSGVWVRPEGEGYICGYSPSDDDEIDHGSDFEVDWSIFEEVIWPALANRISAFEAIRPGNAWAGHYDMCLLDHNAIIGRLGDLKNGFITAGFSGHGLQQSPAIGRGIAEMIVHGQYVSLDLSDLSHARVITNRPLIERNVI